MSDLIDQAAEREQQMRDEALTLRKPVPANCSCGKPVAVLANGVHCKYCKACLAAELAGDLDAA